MTKQSKVTLDVSNAIAVAASSAASPAANASSSRRAPPNYGEPTTRIMVRIPATAVAEPGARSKFGHLGSAGIALDHCSQYRIKEY